MGITNIAHPIHRKFSLIEGDNEVSKGTKGQLDSGSDLIGIRDTTTYYIAESVSR